MKDRKPWKSRSEDKVVGFSSASLFLTRKREALTQGKTRGIDHLTRNGRKSETAGAFT